MIDHELPRNWKDLQEKVAEIFRDIGYKTETDKKLKIARGTVNVDVYSEDVTQSPNIIYICECKHWNSNVPKSVIHSFRAIMEDSGAHYGIVISKKGFQKGAYEAAQNTNIRLADWFEFQEVFKSKWIPAMVERVYKKCEMLITYTEPIIGSSLAEKLDAIKKNRTKKIKKFKELRQKYERIGMTILLLQFGRGITKSNQQIKLPLTLDIPKEKQGGFESVQFSSLRSLLDCLSYWGEKGLKEFDEIFDESS